MSRQSGYFVPFLVLAGLVLVSIHVASLTTSEDSIPTVLAVLGVVAGFVAIIFAALAFYRDYRNYRRDDKTKERARR